MSAQAHENSSNQPPDPADQNQPDINRLHSDASNHLPPPQSQRDSNNSTTSAREGNSGDSTTTDQHLTALNEDTAAAPISSAILPLSLSDSVSED